MNETRVFVAAGHGVGDPGATANGFIERDLNAAVAARLVSRLRDHRLDVATDLDHGNPAFPQEAALAHRTGGIRYYVALHHNCAVAPTSRGAEAFGAPGAGQALARSLHDEVVAALQTVDPELPDRGVKDPGEGAAKHVAAAPGAVAVVEPCFLSSDADAAIVRSSGYVDLLAEALCRGLVDHGRVDGAWAAVYDRAGPELPPVVSVVIPTYGRPELLREAVQSVLDQTVTGLEVLVIDDGGGVPVAPFDDRRVRTMRHDVQRGPAAARNTGLAAGRGRIVAFLDDDDRWTPQRLDLALRGLRRAPVTVCATRHIGQPAIPPRRLEGLIGDHILDDTTPCLGATALRREMVQPFDERWTAIEDVVWWWDLARRVPATTEDEVGYLVRLHDGPRGVNTIRRRVEENLALLAERAEFFGAHRDAAAHRWLRVGIMAEQAGMRATARRAYARHLRLRPRSRALGHLVRAVVMSTRRPVPVPADATAAAPPLRVLHLVASDRPRGAERAARHLADALEMPETQNRVVALRRTSGSDRIEADDTLTGPRVRHLFRWATPVLVQRLRREVHNNPTDVVVAHGGAAALVAAAAAGLGRMPPFVWQRILSLPDRPWWHPKRVCWRFVTWRAAGVVALTERTGDEARQLGFRGPVWDVPNHRPAAVFADVDAAGARLRSDLGIDDHDPVIAFVGHLVHQKHPEAAIEVFRAVRRLVPTASLIVAGDGPRRPAVEAAGAGLGGVHLLGHRSDPEAVLGAADVVLLTSRSDSMPGVVIEAQLAGRPVVTFPVDGVERALVADVTGIVVPPDPTAAAAVVAELLASPDRRAAMARAARDRATELSTESIAPRYRALLAAAAGRGCLRVLHVLPNLGVGGAEQALAVLSRHLDSVDVTQAVVTVSGDRRPRTETVHDRLQARGVARCDLGIRSRPSRNPAALVLAALRLGRVARRFRADVVDAALLDAVLPARLAPGRHRRVTHLVNTPWDPVVAQTTGTSILRRVVLRVVDRVSARRDDAFVAISAAVARSATSDLGLAPDDARLHIVPRGVDVELFTPNGHGSVGPSRLGTGGPCLRLVAVGRLVPQKGHDTLIRAVAACRTKGVCIELRIAGEGPLAAELAELTARLGVEDQVRLLGPVEDVAALIAHADAFALASRWEGQSNAVLEAMASGLCVVVSDLPALAEVGGDAALRVPADDVDAWVRALTDIAGDPGRRHQLGAAARTRAVDRFDADRRSVELADLYRTLVSSPQPAR